MSNAPMSVIYKRTVGPCKDCSERVVGCHSGCSKYIEWKEQEHQRKIATGELNRTLRAVEDYEIKEKLKNIKRRKRRWIIK